MTKPITEPEIDLSGQPDWTPFDAPSLVGSTLRFVSGDRDGNRFRMRYYKDGEGQLQAMTWFGPGCEGPPDHAHGGAIAAVFDEVLGLAAWSAGRSVVVGELTIRFEQLLPIGCVVQVSSRIEQEKGRKLRVTGRICSGEVVYARADCICIEIPAKKNPQIS